MLCTALAGCSPAANKPTGATGGTGAAGGGAVDANATEIHLNFTPMYSAFGGTHTYQIPVTIDGAALDPAGTDPVNTDTVMWIVDKKFVQADPFPDIKGAVMLTTKAAGTTMVTMTANTKNGHKVKGVSTLKITEATDADWEMGQARYDNGVSINFGMFGMMGMMGMGGAAGGAAPAGPPNPANIISMIPKDASCGNCHNNTTGLTVEHTPLQTGGYSDEQLIKIFTMAEKPMGAKFNSPFLKMLPTDFAAQIYTMLHQWSISAEVQKGIVLKLRSITPKAQPEIDLNRLRMMFMNMNMGATAGGTAGDSAAATAGAPGH
jgi:hypothetical protein